MTSYIRVYMTSIPYDINTQVNAFTACVSARHLTSSPVFAKLAPLYCNSHLGPAGRFSKSLKEKECMYTHYLHDNYISDIHG